LTLKSTAESAASKTLELPENVSLQQLPALSASQNRVLGLYCGGTLCAEAQLLALSNGHLPLSNAAIPGAQSVSPGKNLFDNDAHCQFIDLGADEYTQGQPHPMIEPSVRDAVLIKALAQSDVAVIVLDVVLGFGSHPDPAGHVQQLLEQQMALTPNPAQWPIIIASVTGTDADPQCRRVQVGKLESAGVIVAPSNADAVELALGLLPKGCK